MSSFEQHDCPCGIANPGSLCYLIAIVQQLFMIQPFRESILYIGRFLSPNIDEFRRQIEEFASPDKSKFSLCLQSMIALVELFHNLQLNMNQSSTVVDIQPFYVALQNALSKEVDVHKARDASECFGDICKMMNMFFSSPLLPQLSTLSVPSIVQQYLHGELLTTLKPVKLNMDYDYSTMNITRSERFHYLSVDIDSGNLIDGFHSFMKSHFIQFKWKVPIVNEKTNNNNDVKVHQKDIEHSTSMIPLLTEKKTVLKSLPTILVIHLNRFSYSTQYKCKLKLFDYFAFPKTFSATDIITDPIVREGNEPLTSVYNLVGITVHKGETAYDGHYYSIIKNSDNNWMIFDDDNVFSYDKETFDDFYGVNYEQEDSNSGDGDVDGQENCDICDHHSIDDDDDDKTIDSQEPSQCHDTAFLLFYQIALS